MHAGDYVAAEPLYQQALAIQEKALGADHPDMATSLDNLAWLYRSKCRYAEAEPLFQRALAIREKVLNQATQPWDTGSTHKRVISVRPGHRVYESRVD